MNYAQCLTENGRINPDFADVVPISTDLPSMPRPITGDLPPEGTDQRKIYDILLQGPQNYPTLRGILGTGSIGVCLTVLKRKGLIDRDGKHGSYLWRVV